MLRPHIIGAEAKNYIIEYNSISSAVDEDIIKGNIAIIKHTDDGSTQLETPEVGAVFEVYLKRFGSYANAKESERDNLVCDEHGFAQTKDLPYGIYTVHQIKGWEGREMLPDFDVFISENGQTYRYLANNANFESYIKVIKTDAESGLTIPYAGAAFQLYDPDGNKIVMNYTYPEYTEIDTFYTTEDGMLITPQKLEYENGYSLVEVSAPYGYVLDSTPVYQTARRLTTMDISAMSLTQAQRHKVRLLDTWRESRAQYGFAQAVRDGFYRVVVNSGAQGFVPRDMWLTNRLNYCLNAAIEREAYLLGQSE